MMSREYLPFTTDVVFGKVGLEVTFSLEEANFEPAIPPPNPDYFDRMRMRLEKMTQIMGVMVDRPRKSRKL
jgi:hypothetical protein